MVIVINHFHVVVNENLHVIKIIKVDFQVFLIIRVIIIDSEFWMEDFFYENNSKGFCENCDFLVIFIVFWMLTFIFDTISKLNMFL